MKTFRLIVLAILSILQIPMFAASGDVTTSPLTPETGKVYRIFSFGQYNGSTASTTVRKYLTINSSGSVGYSETLDEQSLDMLWEIVATTNETGTTYTFKNFNQEKYLKSNGSSLPLLADEAENFNLPYVKTTNSVATFYFNTLASKCLELGTTQYSVFFKNASADRARFQWGFQAVDKPVFTTPGISLTSANNSIQSVYVNQPISNISYKWGGNATGANITWNGTANATTAPEGITVTTVGKVVTISGAPTSLGSYEYAIIATDGTNNTTPLTGTISAKTTNKIKLAYVTTVTNGVAGANDQPFLNALSTDFDINLISSTATGIDYSFYDIIIQSAIPGSGDAGLAELKTKCLEKPFINMKTFQMQSSRWNWMTPANTTQVTVIVSESAKSHPLFNGITFTGENSNEIALTTATSGNCAVKVTAWAGTPSATPTVLASVKGETDPAYCYLEIPVGTTMNGMTAANQNKQMILGLSEAAWGALTNDAVTLAVNAAKYVVSSGVPTQVNNTSSAKVPVSKEYFDIYGKSVNPDANCVMIEVIKYQDGTTSHKKILRNR